MKSPPGKLRLAACMLLILFVRGLPLARAQEADPELRQLAERGQAELLDKRLGGGSSPQHWQLLAQAYINLAKQSTEKLARDHALHGASKAYQRWIDSLSRRPVEERSAELIVSLARAHLEYGHLFLGIRANPLLDEHDITAGQSTNRAEITGLLEGAVEHYRRADQAIAPLREAALRDPEEFQVAGLDADIQQISLDAVFNLAWSHYYLATLLPSSAAELARVHLNAAEESFRRLADSSAALAAATQVQLGLAMVKRAQRQFPESDRLFNTLLRSLDESSPRLVAQVQVEFARLQLDRFLFEEARRTLAPLTRRDPMRLTGAEAPLRYYINLAKLWHARSYLLEAEHLRVVGGPDAARKAAQVKENGIAQLQQLRTLGPSWPALVQLHIAATVDPEADASSLSPAELIAAANILLDRGRAQDARQRLQLALARSDFGPDARAEALLAMGRCEMALNNATGASAAFLSLAVRAPRHPQAHVAAEAAVRLLAQAAATGAPAQNARLADAIAEVLKAQPSHPRADEMRWMLAVAYQRAERFADAANAYGAIPADDPRAEEARFRRVACSRLFALAQREVLAPVERQQRLRAAADLLEKYADESARAPGTFATRPAVLRWSAEALVQAAELYLGEDLNAPQEALRALQPFEQRYPGSALLGEVLGLRIQALRSLNQLQAASDLVNSFLEKTPASQSTTVLSDLAQGVLDEVERLRDEGDPDAATRLAQTSINTFNHLEHALQSRQAPEEQIRLVRFSRARMLYFAGRHADAAPIVAELHRAHPRNAVYARLDALLKSAALTPSSDPAELRAARDAWAPLLATPNLQTESPDLYWEARYHLLALSARLGEFEEVEKAIRNERAWNPQLGGPKWQPRFEDLYESARQKRPPATP